MCIFVPKKSTRQGIKVYYFFDIKKMVHFSQPIKYVLGMLNEISKLFLKACYLLIKIKCNWC